MKKSEKATIPQSDPENSIKCELCNNEWKKDTKICPVCGSVLIHTCFFCDAVIEDPNVKTCPSCGKPYIPYIKPKEANPETRYKREDAEPAVEEARKRAIEVNKSKEHIYRITKMVVFGSILNKKKKYVGDVDIAIYSELKDKTKDLIEQNENLYLKDWEKGNTKKINRDDRMFYGYTKFLKYIKGDTEIIHLHVGKQVDEMAESTGTANYIYDTGEYKILSLEEEK